MHNSLGEISHRFGKNKTETFLVRRQRSVQEIKKHPVYRTYMISSSYKSLQEEVKRMKKIFAKNNYPSRFVDKCIFNKVYGDRTPVVTVPKKEFTLFLPFLGTTSFKTKNSLVRSFRELLPFSKLKIIFRSSKRLSSCFSFKDKIPNSLMSGVIYKYTCPVCNHSYIGSTKRYWEKRLEEHSHVSALTGKPLNGMQIYAPMQHLRTGSCMVRISRDDFEIIGREKTPYVLKLKESIFISQQKPVLNNNITSVPLHLFSP